MMICMHSNVALKRAQWESRSSVANIFVPSHWSDVKHEICESDMWDGRIAPAPWHKRLFVLRTHRMTVLRTHRMFVRSMSVEFGTGRVAQGIVSSLRCDAVPRQRKKTRDVEKVVCAVQCVEHAQVARPKDAW